MEGNPKELPEEFIGRGEVKGNSFKQIARSDEAYIYEVKASKNCKWYEVFKRIEDSRFGKISYPKSNSFGVTAWTSKSYERAVEIFNRINKT
jgi:hypothetical protein